MVQPQASQDRAEWNDTVELLGLTRRYGDLIALDDVSFTVAEGRCSSRWPNGAGKTTAMRIGLGAGAQRW
jgi:ABC-type multidrug transport system ATPase subunit